jgi:hypothetical protein
MNGSTSASGRPSSSRARMRILSSGGRALLSRKGTSRACGGVTTRAPGSSEPLEGGRDCWIERVLSPALTSPLIGTAAFDLEPDSTRRPDAFRTEGCSVSLDGRRSVEMRTQRVWPCRRSLRRSEMSKTALGYSSPCWSRVASCFRSTPSSGSSSVSATRPWVDADVTDTGEVVNGAAGPDADSCTVVASAGMAMVLHGSPTR